MIDGIAYFTGAISVPSGLLEGIPYFTNGLCIPSSGQAIEAKGGIHWMRKSRERFVKMARQDAEDIDVILAVMTVIDNERDD